MSDSIVERITDILVSDGCGDSDQCEKTARRVLSALREPTEAMADAGCCRDRNGDFVTLNDDAAESWKRMIDAALRDV